MSATRAQRLPARETLPAPDAAGRAHSERVSALVRERVSSGALPFVDYMALALYAPGLGYYMAGAPKFGAEGDFVTAPELSPLFGQCLARSCASVLDELEPPYGILELGAGSGRLAASLLAALPRVVPYTILEPSAELRERQRTRLAAALSVERFREVRWIESLPARFTGVVLANEVMDALPVERFVRRGGQVLQVCVGLAESDEGGLADGFEDGFEDGSEGNAEERSGDRLGSNLRGDDESVNGGSAFVDTLRTAPDALTSAVEAIEADLGGELPEGYASELCPSLGPWLHSLADMLEQGALLLADYGYPRREFYLAERDTGTLACYYRHRAHGDPYRWPGLQDITAHVDFTRVTEAATTAGLELLGYTTQSAFLLDCGLSELAAAERDTLSHETDRIALARAVRTLTLPGEMGERFQFIAFGRGCERVPHGFGLQDLAHRL